MVNVGVIGAGLMGSTHARLLATAIAGAEVVAISDAVHEHAQRIADELDLSTIHADGMELIANPAVDAVVIASPAATHEPYTLACIEVGKPVLCEKPLATSAAAAKRIVEAEAAVGHRSVTVGFMRRYDPGYADLKARLDAGAIGAPLLMHCAHRNPSVHPFFDSAMIITDSAVHEIDVTRWLLGEEIVRATVLTPTPTSKAREGLRDPQLLLFETAGGRLVDVEAFVSAGYAYDIRCEVVGEDGTLELLPPATVALRTDNAESQAIPPGFRERFGTAYLHELQAWIHSIARGSEPDGPSAYDGFAAAAVSEAAVASLESGRPVDVAL
ncbi:Gfo/Idh/MocA family oxidoreductase [Solirubrobacter ginsenosidimutans]|uniref:Inositol 2-dehydrogenase n=1 Tax=Solirubrobacter ginsenosidimutans TaxID=490573 RepID=A0A9X3MWP6_9ACTN|nr:Gfo/Idh/MocA family oxidoreductase [Solirubrobacter ginsenosidimutans]